MKKILALVVFSDAMPEVVRMAGRISRAFEGTAYLVYVADPESDYNGDELRKDVSRRGLAPKCTVSTGSFNCRQRC